MSYSRNFDCDELKKITAKVNCVVRGGGHLSPPDLSINAHVLIYLQPFHNPSPARHTEIVIYQWLTIWEENIMEGLQDAVHYASVARLFV